MAKPDNGMTALEVKYVCKLDLFVWIYDNHECEHYY